jgi:hypothetical protein
LSSHRKLPSRKKTDDTATRGREDGEGARASAARAPSSEQPQLQKLFWHSPLAHSPFDVQLEPLSFKHMPRPLHARFPVQATPPGADGSDCPCGTKEQVPCFPETPHDTHVPSHALLQHTPSMQKLLAHWAESVQELPSAVLQMPAPSQALPLLHGIIPLESGTFTGVNEQVPFSPATLHDWHVPVHAVSQHALSTQEPLAHSLLLEQELPFASLQAPRPSQACVPVQVPLWPMSGCPGGMFTHAPRLPVRLQAWQVPQNVAQQTPSMQLLSLHCELEVQVCPLIFLGVQTPLLTLRSQNCVASQNESTTHCWHVPLGQ